MQGMLSDPSSFSQQSDTCLSLSCLRQSWSYSSFTSAPTQAPTAAGAQEIQRGPRPAHARSSALMNGVSSDDDNAGVTQGPDVRQASSPCNQLMPQCFLERAQAAASCCSVCLSVGSTTAAGEHNASSTCVLKLWGCLCRAEASTEGGRAHPPARHLQVCHGGPAADLCCYRPQVHSQQHSVTCEWCSVLRCAPVSFKQLGALAEQHRSPALKVRFVGMISCACVTALAIRLVRCSCKNSSLMSWPASQRGTGQDLSGGSNSARDPWHCSCRASQPRCPAKPQSQCAHGRPLLRRRPALGPAAGRIQSFSSHKSHAWESRLWLHALRLTDGTHSLCAAAGGIRSRRSWPA